MTKKEWKSKLIDLLMNEPETGNNKFTTREDWEDYINELEGISDSYYGISHEIIIAIEKHLDK